MIVACEPNRKAWGWKVYGLHLFFTRSKQGWRQRKNWRPLIHTVREWNNKMLYTMLWALVSGKRWGTAALLSDRVRLTGQHIQNICNAVRHYEKEEKSYCVFNPKFVSKFFGRHQQDNILKNCCCGVEGWVCVGAIVPHGTLVMNQYPSKVTAFGHESPRDSLTLVAMNFLLGISTVTQGKDSTVSHFFSPQSRYKHWTL